MSDPAPNESKDSHEQVATKPPAHEHRRLHPPERTAAIWVPIVIVALLALFLVIGILRHLHERNAQENFAKKNAEVSVTVVQAERATKQKELHLPGNIEAFQETTIFPRANGYVAKWLVDIGDNVTDGQLLAEIET